MNVETISMDKIAAREAFAHYRAAVKERHNKEDEALMLGYRALAKGQQLLELHGVMRAAGVDEQRRPRLAICRADAQVCTLSREWIYTGNSRETVRFSAGQQAAYHQSTRSYVEVPRSTWPEVTARQQRAMVPLIPPQYRPAAGLHLFHILWEAVWEPAPPVDPILLRRLHGSVYAVLAQWDLTPLERAVMHGRLAQR